MAPSSTSSAARQLRDADASLARARDHLDRSPVDYAAALEEVTDSVRASLLAFLAGYGCTADPDAPISTLAARAVRCDSALKTAAHRAVHLAERAPSIRQSARPTVHDREDVETGWYTARNLSRTVRAQTAGLPKSS